MKSGNFEGDEKVERDALDDEGDGDDEVDDADDAKKRLNQVQCQALGVESLVELLQISQYA